MKTQMRVNPTQQQVDKVSEKYSTAHLNLITSNFLPKDGYNPIVFENCSKEVILKIQNFYEANSLEVCLLQNNKDLLILIKLSKLPELLFILN
jgi:hypothetical protein